jgi:hypothetical protein
VEDIERLVVSGGSSLLFPSKNVTSSRSLLPLSSLSPFTLCKCANCAPILGGSSSSVCLKPSELDPMAGLKSLGVLEKRLSKRNRKKSTKNV